MGKLYDLAVGGEDGLVTAAERAKLNNLSEADVAGLVADLAALQIAAGDNLDKTGSRLDVVPSGSVGDIQLNAGTLGADSALNWDGTRLQLKGTLYFADSIFTQTSGQSFFIQPEDGLFSTDAGGGFLASGGDGCNADSSNNATAGGPIVLHAGKGGGGEADHAGGNGGDFDIRSGVAGDDGGAGPGTNGVVTISCGSTLQATVNDNGITVAKTATAGTFSGVASGLTSIPAAQLTGSHTTPDGVLSTNVALLNASESFSGGNVTFTGTVLHSGATNFTSASNTFAGVLTTSVKPASASGTLFLAGNTVTTTGIDSVNVNPTYSGTISGTCNTIKSDVTKSSFTGTLNLLWLGVGGVAKTNVDDGGNATFAGAITSTGNVNPSGDRLGGGNLLLQTSQAITHAWPTVQLANGYRYVTFTGGVRNESSGTNVMFGLAPTYQQSGTAAAVDWKINRTETSLGSGVQLFEDYQVAGSRKWAIEHGGNIWTANGASATTLGSVVKKLPIYDAAGTLLGYIPIYDAIT